MKTIHNISYRKSVALLKAKRLERGITQEALAEKLGVSQAVISKIETSERRLDIIELREICRAIEISFIEYIKDVEKL